MVFKTIVLALTVLSIGCTTADPISSFHSVSLEQRGQCKEQCGKLEMELSSMVIVGNATGCVCDLKSENKTTNMSKKDHPGVAGAMARVIQLERQRQQQQSSQNNSGGSGAY